MKCFHFFINCYIEVLGYISALCTWRIELRQQQDQLQREQEKMRRSMKLAERRAREEASRREEYAKSLEAKFEKERQEYRRQVDLIYIITT